VAETYGKGRTLLAEPALEAGMVDGIATLEETIVAQGGTLEPSAAASARTGRRAEKDEPKPSAEETLKATAAVDEPPAPVEPEKPELSDEQRQRLADVLLG
jgi:hypothetical protein